MNKKLSEWIVPVKKLIINYDTIKWCKLPYPNHPKGCPQFNKKKTCPPNAPHVEDYFNIAKPLYLVHSEFNLYAHINKMKINHPNWSRLQLRCVLYWQDKSRNQLKERTCIAVSSLKANKVAYCPEAMGVNVFATAKLSGLHLEKIKDLKICRHVALIGYGSGKYMKRFGKIN